MRRLGFTMLGIYPSAAETVVTVTRAVDEESRDVRAGVLHCLIS